MIRTHWFFAIKNPRAKQATGEIASGAAVIVAAKKIDPDIAHSGITQAELKNYCDGLSGDVGIASCTMLLADQPDDAEAYVRRGELYRIKGENEPALADLRRATDVEPRNAAAYHGSCLVFWEMKDFKSALADCNKAIEIDPNNVSFYNGRGLIYEATNDLDLALADYSKAIELDPKDATDYFNRGTVYKNKGDLNRALDDYNIAIALNPNDGEAYRKRGIVYEAKGDRVRATADYDQADKLELQAMTKPSQAK